MWSASPSLFIHSKCSMLLFECCYQCDKLLCLKVPVSAKSVVLEEWIRASVTHMIHICWIEQNEAGPEKTETGREKKSQVGRRKGMFYTNNTQNLPEKNESVLEPVDSVYTSLRRSQWVRPFFQIKIIFPTAARHKANVFPALLSRCRSTCLFSLWIKTMKTFQLSFALHHLPLQETF